ncbi:MAG: four helix bundle protein [Candidatus Uhrbacteria bacterium]
MSRNYDLQERTSKFGEGIIGFCRELRQDVISRPIISQLVRSGTSIGANYMEACCASSRKDFRHKIFLSKKEAQETKFWLRMALQYFPDKKETIARFTQECGELICILQKSTDTLDENSEYRD